MGRDRYRRSSRSRERRRSRESRRSRERRRRSSSGSRSPARWPHQQQPQPQPFYMPVAQGYMQQPFYPPPGPQPIYYANQGGNQGGQRYEKMVPAALLNRQQAANRKIIRDLRAQLEDHQGKKPRSKSGKQPSNTPKPSTSREDSKKKPDGKKSNNGEEAASDREDSKKQAGEKKSNNGEEAASEAPGARAWSQQMEQKCYKCDQDNVLMFSICKECLPPEFKKD